MSNEDKKPDKDERSMTAPLRAAVGAYRAMSKKLLCPICSERGCEHTPLEKLLEDAKKIK